MEKPLFLTSFLNIQKDENGFLSMPFEPQNLNHVGTSHAAAQFALAEFATGSYLQDRFPDLKAEVIGVIRKAAVRYRSPGRSRLYAVVDFPEDQAELVYKRVTTRKAAPATLDVALFDETDTLVFQGTFEWFLTKIINLPENV